MYDYDNYIKDCRLSLWVVSFFNVNACSSFALFSVSPYFYLLVCLCVSLLIHLSCSGSRGLKVKVFTSHSKVPGLNPGSDGNIFFSKIISFHLFSGSLAIFCRLLSSPFSAPTSSPPLPPHLSSWLSLQHFFC